MSLVSGCATERAGRVTAPYVARDTKLPDEFEAAIADALNPEPDEVVHDLIAIVADEPGLYWKLIDGVDHVLMSSVVAKDTYYVDHVGKSYETGSHYLWVTAVPELQKVCRASGKGAALRKRLRQRLGLTPGAALSAVVEFWVQPMDLFRPAPDNEVTDRTAGLVMPPDTEAWYRKWFNELRSHQYFQSTLPGNDAYPWTQLGYTYDWGGGMERGISEFVIRTDRMIGVNAIYDVDEYCAP